MDAAAVDGRMGALRLAAKAQTPEAAREVARQFEALFAQQLLSGLRSTAQVPGSGVTDLGPMQSVMDQQMSALLTRGKGLGLAEQLMQQWQQSGQVAGPATADSPHVLPALGTAPAVRAAAITPGAPDPAAPDGGWRAHARKFVEDLLPLAREAAAKRPPWRPCGCGCDAHDDHSVTSAFLASWASREITALDVQRQAQPGQLRARGVQRGGELIRAGGVLLGGPQLLVQHPLAQRPKRLLAMVGAPVVVGRDGVGFPRPFQP